MKRPTTHNIQTPIASLIDIVFLLIIFFVVTSAIDQESFDPRVQLAETYNVDPVTRRDPRTVTINLRKISDQETALNIANIPLSLDSLGIVLKKSSLRHGNDFPIVLRADADIRYEQVDNIISFVARLGLFKIRLAAQDLGQH